MGTPRRLASVLIVVAVALLTLAAGAQGAVRGSALQLSGTLGCLSSDGSGPSGLAGACTDARAIAQLSDLAVSPDGRNVYTGQYGGSGVPGGLGVFSRDPATGALTQLPGTQGCISQTGASVDGGAGTCADGRAVDGGEGHGIAVSPDGRFLYAGTYDGAIAVFARNPATGELAQASGTQGCYTATGASEDGAGTCTAIAQLGAVSALTMSPDGHQLYSSYAGGANRILTLTRNTDNGALSLAGCLVDAAAAAGCTSARQVGYGQHLAITPDGRHAYGAQYNQSGVSILDRDPASGALTQPAGPAGCISEDGGSWAGAGTCQDVRGIGGAFDTAVSLDGRTLWVNGYDDEAIATFRIDPATGALTQLAGTAGCVSSDGSSDDGPATCANGRGIGEPYGLTLAPDGRTLYQNEYSLGGFTAWSVDEATGALTQLPGTDGCVSPDGKGINDPTEAAVGTCATAPQIPTGTYSLALSPDGDSLYATGYTDHGTLGAFSVQVAPRCVNTSGEARSGQTATVALSCTDFNGDPLTVEIVTPPAHGTAVVSGADTASYTPTVGYAGTDTFTFRADDGHGAGAVATATISDVVPPAPGPPVDRTRPVISEASLSRSAFRFTLSENAKVTLTVSRRDVGKRSGKRCVKPTRKLRKARSCTRLTKIGTLSATGKKGANGVTFKNKVGKRPLKPGKYQAVLVARDPAGNASKSTTVTFTVKKAHKKKQG